MDAWHGMGLLVPWLSLLDSETELNFDVYVFGHGGAWNGNLACQ